MDLHLKNKYSDLPVCSSDAFPVANESQFISILNGCKIHFGLDGGDYDSNGHNKKINCMLTLAPAATEYLLKTMTVSAKQHVRTSSQLIVSLPPDAQARLLMLKKMHSRVGMNSRL